MSHDGEDYTQIAFLRSDIDDSTGEYTERFEAGSFDMPAADALRFDLAVDLMDYFSGRTFEGEPGVSRGLEPREAVAAVEGATGCDLNFFEDFWLGSPGEIVESVHVGPYTKQSLLDFSYYAKELSRRYGFADSDILEIARHLPEECPDRFAAVKAYLDCEYVPDGDAPDEKTYRWGDFLEIAGGDARYAAMLVDRTAAGESEEGLHPETLVDQDIRDGEAFMLAGRPIASQGTTIEKVVNDPVTKFERSFREDIFNSQQNSLVGLTVLATLPLDAFLDASLSMICRGDREKAGTFTVKPGTYEPIMGIYDPINGCGGTAGIELDTDFDIDPRDIKYTMMEPRGGKWESDRIDLYTPQDCFGFSEPFAGRIEYSEKKPKIAAKAKPDPADLGRRASVAAGATIRDGVDGGGIKL